MDRVWPATALAWAGICVWLGLAAQDLVIGVLLALLFGTIGRSRRRRGR